jgi:hypothetical protein
LYDDPRPKHPESSLESAEAVCRSCLPPDGDIAPDELFDLWSSQVQALKSWASETHSIVSRELLPSLKERTNEHFVAFRESDGRWIKVTKPGRFGFIADVDFSLDKLSQGWIGKIILREALPSEYLARLLLHNRVFEDAISLEGILVGESEISLVVSQPDISGMPASLDEISTAMAGLGFEKIPGLHLGYPQSLSFFRDSDKLLIVDAHPANAFTSQGVVFPIDFIIQHASNWMVKEIRELLR